MSAQTGATTSAPRARSLLERRRTAQASSGGRVSGYRFKRIFDVVFTTLVLTLGSPIYLVLGLLVALTSPGPVLYRHERVGHGGQRFDCLKFRTMVDDAEEHLESILASCPDSRAEFQRCFKLKDDPRITRVGRFLRRTSLDELPQFWNVLRGDMSVVGPRPVVEEELGKYGENARDYLSIRPGITGVWQVSGRNHTTYRERVEMDAAYARKHRFGQDLATIARTLVVMVQRHRSGAY